MASPTASRNDYDLVVIGAGSGGLATAKRAASYAARVAIVEEDRVGGTCVIRGCIPKKLMVYAAELGHAIEDAGGFGWNAGSATLDWPELVRKRDETVAGLERTHERLLAEAGVELLRGHATVVAAGRIALEGRDLRAAHILVATGSRPVLPPVEGIEHAITSDGFFELGSRPRSVAIVGGGYIACEFASIARGLGCEVSLIIRRDLPLRGFDEDLRKELRDALVGQGIDVRFETTVEAIDRRDEATVLRLAGGDGAQTLEVDHALVYAVGRDASTDGLGLEAAGIELGSRGEVVVDDDGRTSVEGIFAVGDVTNRMHLTPVAIQAGRALADRVFGGKQTKMSYEGVPTAVFTSPPIGTVGLTEEEAVARSGRDALAIYKAGFNPLIHTFTERKVRTFVKLIVEKTTDKVLGCHIIGHDAPEIIQGFGVALKAGATKADFDATVGIHPSSAEELVTLS